jgi:hypothetical protein
VLIARKALKCLRVLFIPLRPRFATSNDPAYTTQPKLPPYCRL